MLISIKISFKSGISSTVSEKNVYTNEYLGVLLNYAGMTSSAYEGAIWEEITGRTSISTEGSRMAARVIHAMEKAGMDDSFIKKTAEKLGAEGFGRIGSLADKGLSQEFLEKVLDNQSVLDTVSDDILLLFKNSTRSCDDILTVLARHGDEAGKLYELYGDEVIDVALKYGDDGLAGIQKYGTDFMIEYHAYGDEFVENYLKHGDEAIDAYVRYGDDAADVLKGGSIQTEIPSVKDSGISIKPESSPFKTVEVNGNNVINGEGAWHRDVDTEYKILSDIQSKLGIIIQHQGKLNSILN